MTNFDTSQRKQKCLGQYLVEAGLITSEQLETELNEQNSSGRLLEEILKMYGCEQQTIEFFMEKIVLPQRLPLNRKQSDINNNLVERDIDLAQLKTLPILNFLVRLSPKKTLQFLFLVILSLSLISFGFQLSLYLLPDYPLNHILSGLFNVNAEQNIPTLYSVLALLFSSIVLFAIAYAKTVTSEPFVGYWGALSIIFVYLTCDEFMVLHERLIDPV